MPQRTPLVATLPPDTAQVVVFHEAKPVYRDSDRLAKAVTRAVFMQAHGILLIEHAAVPNGYWSVKVPTPERHLTFCYTAAKATRDAVEAADAWRSKVTAAALDTARPRKVKP